MTDAKTVSASPSPQISSSSAPPPPPLPPPPPPTPPPPAYDGTFDSSPSAAAAPAPFRTKFALLSLHRSDLIRLVRFGPDDLAAVRGVLSQTWRGGIQAERPYLVSHEFKLRGRPWNGGSTGSHAVPAIRLMLDLLACLYSRGWILTASTDVSRKEFSKDTLLFRRRQVDGPMPLVSWMAVSFKQGDKIRLLGAPPDLVAGMGETLTRMRLLQASSVKNPARGQYEFKMYGYLWEATGASVMVARLLLLRLLEVLERHGWSLYACIDHSSGPSSTSNYSDTDCWYCVKSSNWTPGSIVAHR